MKNLFVILTLGFLGSNAFAYINDFEAATKNMTPMISATSQCHLNINDKVNGMALTSSAFSPVSNRLRADETYLSLWQDHLGTDDSSLFAFVEPFADKDGKILLRILIANNPRKHDPSGRRESVELIGIQNSATTVAFHGWSDNKFDALRDAEKQFDINGSINDGTFSISGETDELKYDLNCKF